MVNKSNLEIKRSGANNTQPWRWRLGSTDSLNTTLWHWSQDTITCSSRRSIALSEPKGILAAKAPGQPHSSLPGCTVHGERLRSSIVPAGTVHDGACSAPTFAPRAKPLGSRAGEQTAGVMKMQRLPPASPHSYLAPKIRIVTFYGT